MGTCKGGLKPPRSPTCVKFSNLTFCGGLEHSSTSSSALILDIGEVSNNDEVLKERKFTILVTFLLPFVVVVNDKQWSRKDWKWSWTFFYNFHFGYYSMHVYVI